MACCGASVHVAAHPDLQGSAKNVARSDHPCNRSEEHTSELQSQSNLVCRLLLEKKKNSYVTGALGGATEDAVGVASSTVQALVVGISAGAVADRLDGSQIVSPIRQHARLSD